jgi:two-component system, NtrC family, sensor histidine kinase HydH
MRKVERFIIAIPICFTLLAGWFSWSTFQAAPHIAEENLRGAGLYIAAAIEQLAAVDPGFQSLARYRTADIAYFSLVDQQKVVRFHTNSALAGTISAEAPPRIDSKSGVYEERKKLGTGEEIYLLQTTIHIAGDDCLLTLGLHTFRADRVIRQAQTGLTVVAFLTFSLWFVTLGVLFLLWRDEKRQHELVRQEDLARLGVVGAVMAHEIRNPLAGIKGFAQLMETAETIDQARHYAGRIVTQSLRMESLVNDLLSFAREDRGERQPADLEMLVKDCITLIQAEADSARIQVNYTRQAALKVTVVSDRIIQLLLNLLKNGLQAMPDGGELRVELEKIKSLARIKVCDSGTGIPPEDLPHIFKPFWTSKARGTGLGLALCYKIAMEHGGNLTVESIVGAGTTFTLHLPLEI